MKCKIGVDKPQPLLYNKIIKRKELIKMLTKNPNKKERKEYNKQNRVLVTFNTGTRIHKDKKKYNRADGKKALRNYF